MLFEAFNFDYFGPIDGHNLDHLIDILNNIKGPKDPVLLHVSTKKGKGYRYPPAPVSTSRPLGECLSAPLRYFVLQGTKLLFRHVAPNASEFQGEIFPLFLALQPQTEIMDDVVKLSHLWFRNLAQLFDDLFSMHYRVPIFVFNEG